MSHSIALLHPFAREDRRRRGAGRREDPEPLAVGEAHAHPPLMPRQEPRDLPSPDIDLPPGGPLSDEPQMETDRHSKQLGLLLELGDWVLRDREDAFFAGNISIFFSPEQLKRQDFRGPDFFLVLGTDRRERNSWVVWQEGGRFPDLIIELLSRSTRKNDLGPKKQVYQDVFRTPEYYAFDPQRGELLGFELIEGVYERRAPDARGRLWSERLGHFLGVHEGWLRLFTREGALVPTGVERGLLAEAAEQRARQQAKRAEAAEQRAERLAERLRELGVDPDAAV